MTTVKSRVVDCLGQQHNQGFSCSLYKENLMSMYYVTFGQKSSKLNNRPHSLLLATIGTILKTFLRTASYSHQFNEKIRNLQMPIGTSIIIRGSSSNTILKFFSLHNKMKKNQVTLTCSSVKLGVTHVQLRGNQKDFNLQLHHRLSKFEVPVVVN